MEGRGGLWGRPFSEGLSGLGGVGAGGGGNTETGPLSETADLYFFWEVISERAGSLKV